MTQQKKQMRLYNLYKALVDNERDDIRNIIRYEVARSTQDPTNIVLKIAWIDATRDTYVMRTLDDKKTVIKMVNKHIKELEVNHDVAV